MVGGGEGALEVHVDHGVPVELGHREHHAVPQDPGVVDQDVATPERVDGLVDHLAGGVEVGHVGAVDDCLAAHGLDLGHDLLGGREVGSAAGSVAAEVVDDDPGAVFGQQQGVFAADAPPRTRHNRNAARTQVTHGFLLPRCPRQ